MPTLRAMPKVVTLTDAAEHAPARDPAQATQRILQNFEKIVVGGHRGRPSRSLR